MRTQLTALILLCLIGTIGSAQIHVARDISAELSDAELERAQQLVRECLLGREIGRIDERYASATQKRESLNLLFTWLDDGPGRRIRYDATFSRESGADEWKLYEINSTGEQMLPDQLSPVYLRGYVSADAFEEVIGRAAELWQRTVADPFEVAGIVTNDEPPNLCQAAGRHTGDRVLLYDVAIKNLTPRERPPPKAEPNTVTLASSSSMDDSYRIRFRRESDSNLVSTDVECLGGAYCDPDLLAQLNENVDEPADEGEMAERLNAALVALPDAYRNPEVETAQSHLHGRRELFLVQFAKTAVSDVRKERASVHCVREAGSPGDWHCQYMPHAAEQTIPGQAAPVHLMLSGRPLDEAEVERMTTELRRELATHADIAGSPGDIIFFTISPDIEGFRCMFNRGSDTYIANFDFEERIEIRSVELRWRANDDGSVTEF